MMKMMMKRRMKILILDLLKDKEDLFCQTINGSKSRDVFVNTSLPFCPYFAKFTLQSSSSVDSITVNFEISAKLSKIS